MFRFTLVSLLLSAFLGLSAQVSITATGSPVGIDISDFTGAGFQPGGGGGTLNSDIFAAEGFSTGGVNFGETALAGDLARGTAELGTITTGGIYALAIPAPVHIWIQPTADDFTPGSITVRLQNNTAVTLGEMQINYTAWASNDEDRSNNLVCTYSTNNVDYFPIAGAEFISPDSADLLLYEVPFEVTATGFSVAPGEYFYVRWTGNDVGGGGSRDEFGLTGFEFTAFEAGATPVYNFSPASVDVIESAGATSIELTISESADCILSFAYDPASTATPAFDYGLGVFSHTFTAGGPTSVTIDIGIVDDLTTEATETGIIYVNDVVGGCIPGVTPSSTIFIIDNDSIVPPIGGFTTIGVTETESVGSVFGTVEISEPADCVFQMYLDGASTMENGLDYSFLLPEFITFNVAGPTTSTFEVPIIDDLDIESTEMLLINIIPWTGTCIVAGIGDYEINITDNDVASIPNVSFVVESDLVSESDPSFTANIILSESDDCTVEVSATPASTAINGLDYSATLPAEITFTDGGATVLALSGNIINDAEVEPIETIIFTLEITGGSCTLGAITTHTVSIEDNDEVGVENVLSDAISIIPNPATDFIRLDGVSNIHQVRITDMQGNVWQAFSNTQNIDISSLAAGTYMLVIETDLGIGRKTFIKQ